MVKYKLGDKISVIEESMTGVIVGVDGYNITFETEEGFLLTYKAKELVFFSSDFENKMKNTFIKSKENTSSSKIKSKGAKSKALFEIDLHYEKLPKKHQNLPIIEQQLHYAKMHLTQAHKRRVPRLVIIHGIGDGKLKKELINLLKLFPVTISDASYQKYGQGATEVYFIQNTTSLQEW